MLYKEHKYARSTEIQNDINSGSKLIYFYKIQSKIFFNFKKLGILNRANMQLKENAKIIII